MKRLLFRLFILSMLLSACGGSPAAPTAALATTTTPIAVPTTSAAAVPTSAAVAPVAVTPVPAATKAPVATAVPATAVPATTNAPAAAPAPSGSAKDAIIAAMQASLKVGPYRTKTTVVSDSGTVNMTSELIPPDRLHTTLQTTGYETEMIIIADKGWNKKDGKWAVSPMSGKVALQAAFPVLTAESLGSTISDAKALGTEAVNGEQARVYTYTSTTDLGQGTTVISAVKLWVSAKRGLPVQQEIVGAAGGVKSTSVQTIEYDPAITIVPPM